MSERPRSVSASFWGGSDETEALECYDTLVNAVDDGIYQLDAKGRFVGVNDMIVETTGYSREELLGKHVSVVLDDDDIERIKRDFLDRLQTGNVDDVTTYETTIETADGDVLFCDLRISLLISDGTFRGSVGIVRDITERKQRERRLEGELGEVMGRISDAFYAVDTKWQFTHVNEQMEELVGMSEDKLVGKSIWNVFSEAVNTEFYEMDHLAMETGEPLSYEVYYEPWDAWYERHLYPNETGMSVYFRDITERKERERELQQTTDQLESLFEILPVGVIVADADGQLVDANEHAKEIWGGDIFDAESIDEYDKYPATWADTGEPVAPEEWTMSRVLDGEEVIDSDVYEIETVNGERRIITAAGMPVQDGNDEVTRGVVTITDVTEQRKHQRKLQESERRYRTLVENFPNGSVALFDENLQYTAAGGQLLDDLSQEVGDPVGESIQERYPDELFEEIEPYFRRALAGETTEFEVEYHNRHLLAYTLPVRDTDDNIFAGMLMVQDITERRKYQQQIEESNERLEQFAYAASHDLQEPLRMVSSYLQLLERRYADQIDEDGREFIDFAVDGADRMREMIEGLLQYSRVETQGDPFEPVELDDVFEDVRTDLQFQIVESDAEITADSLPRVHCDAGQLRQVFQNLLSNAIEYSGDEPPRIHISAQRKEAKWQIRVRDEGIGINPDDTDRIFRVFQRLHSRDEHPGTGIGLALCQRIVERHGGEIWVDSTPGEGSTFSFTLPAAAE